MINTMLYLVVGAFAGVISGVAGIGGGIVVVPCLLYIFHFSQHKAQGTSLAMLLPPIGILAVWEYYKQANVDIKVAAFLAAGFILGGLVGGKFAVMLSDQILKKIFGVVLLLIALENIFSK